MLNYSDFLVIIYDDSNFVDIYKKSGQLYERHNVEYFFINSKLILKSIDCIKFAKLDWSDRYFDIIQQS